MKINAAGVLMCLALAAPCGAAQVGGLAWPGEAGGFTTSITVAYGEQDVKDGDDDTVSTYRNILKAEYGLMDNLGVYGALGLSDVDVDEAGYRHSRGWSGTGGLRYGMVRSGDRTLQLVLDLEAEYLRVGDLTRTSGRAATYLVRQFGAAGSVGYFYPYGGFQVSYAKYKGRGEVDEDYRGKSFVGFFGGADYFVSPNIYFAGELHLFDETSAYLGVGYKF